MDDGCPCCGFFFSSSFSVFLKEISSMLGYFFGCFLLKQSANSHMRNVMSHWVRQCVFSPSLELLFLPMYVHMHLSWQIPFDKTYRNRQSPSAHQQQCSSAQRPKQEASSVLFISHCTRLDHLPAGCGCGRRVAGPQPCCEPRGTLPPHHSCCEC